MAVKKPEYRNATPISALHPHNRTTTAGEALREKGSSVMSARRCTCAFPFACSVPPTNGRMLRESNMVGDVVYLHRYWLLSSLPKPSIYFLPLHLAPHSPSSFSFAEPIIHLYLTLGHHSLLHFFFFSFLSSSDILSFSLCLSFSFFPRSLIFHLYHLSSTPFFLSSFLLSRQHPPTATLLAITFDSYALFSSLLFLLPAVTL